MKTISTHCPKALLLSVLCLLNLSLLQAQVTLSTTTTGYVYNAETGGAIVFAVRNNNANAVMLTDLGSMHESGYTPTYTLWYKATPLVGAPGAITAANGWTQIGNSYTVPNTQPTGIAPLFSGLNFQIPANTTYRFALLGTGARSPFYATANSSANIFSASGVDILGQDNPVSPGYGGNSTPTNTPRGFYGSITFQPVDACSTPPVPGTVTVLPSTICSGSPVSLSVNGNSFATGNTYTWQSSSSSSGPFTDVSTSTTTNSLTLNITTSAYYRLQTKCGSGTEVFTTPQLLTANSLLGGNVYSINNTMPTGGLNFNSFTDAFNALSCGITGKVVFEVAAGQVFNETPPEFNATGTVTDSIIFRKAGSGFNPVIKPSSPGTIASSTTISNNGDGVIVINGGDYIVFDAIDIDASNYTSGNAMYEYGYYLKKKSGTDACKNVVIKNSVIKLSKAIYSFGIHISNNSGANSNITIPYTSGAHENIKISGNTIQNAYGGICVKGYSTESLFDQNIEIGVDSGNVITNFGGGATTAYGIYTIYQNNIKIGKNIITSAASGHTSTLYGIYTGSAVNANVDIFKNTVTVQSGSTTSSAYAISNAAGGSGTSNLVNIYDNNITGCTYLTSTSGDFYGINQSATAYKAHIHGNTLINNKLTTTSAGIFYGIYQTGSVVNESKIFNNVISEDTLRGTTGAFYAINNSPATGANSEIYGNTVSNLYHVATTSGILFGIAQTAGATTNIYKNQIFNLTNSSTGGSVYGLSVTAGTQNNVYNNFISDLKAPTTSITGEAIRGISIAYSTANTNIKVVHNTVYLNASAGGTNFSTAGIYHTASATATSANLTMQNNIIINVSVPRGTGVTSVFRRSSTALGNYNNQSNYNLFYAGTPSSSRVLLFDGTNKYETLIGYKTALASADQNTVKEMVPFVNITTTPYNLHINTSVPTQAEGKALALPEITEDIDGDARNASTPDIGADEFNGTPALAMTYASSTAVQTAGRVYRSVPNQVIMRLEVSTTGDADPVALTKLVLNANGTTNINDINTGVATVYYTGNAPTFSNAIPFGTAIPTIASFDVTGYQELVSGTNYFWLVYEISPAATQGNVVDAEFTGVEINNTTIYTPTLTAPAANKMIVGPMAGHYNVGPSLSYPHFTSFTEAVNDLNLRGVADSVFIDAVPGSGPYNEQIKIKNITGASDVNTITFNGNGVIITDNGTANTNERAVIKLDSARYVIINNFNIHTGSGTHGYGVQLLNDADNNTVKNCIILTDSSATGTTYAGILITPTNAAAPTGTGASLCDNNTFIGNTINGGYTGISLTANGSTSSILGNKVINNRIEDFYLYGIYMNGNEGTLVEGNDISRPKRTAFSTFYGVYFTGISKSTVVSKNRIHNPADGNNASTTAAYGVDLVNCDATSGTENIIVNNLIYNFNNAGTQNGILNNGSDYVKIYHNTISLDDVSATCTTCATRGLYEQVAGTLGLEFVNNIVTIRRGGSGDKQLLYFTSTSVAGITIDNNAYYIDPTLAGTKELARVGSTGYVTLNDWQATSKDGFSKYENPVYKDTAAANFKPLNSAIDNIGMPIGITEDFEGTARSLITPDAGAYEFSLITSGLNVGAESFASPSIAATGCYENETVKVVIRNSSTSAIDFSQNPITVTALVTGVATVTLTGTVTTGTLLSNDTVHVTMSQPFNMSADGTYNFKAYVTLAGDVSNSNDTTSIITRTKEALSAGTVSVSPDSYCITGDTPTLTASGLNGYASLQWQQSTNSLTGFTDISGATANPYVVSNAIAQTMYYRVKAICGTAEAASAEDTVVILNPQITSITPDTTCGTGSVTLLASATQGATINWYNVATGGSPIATGTSFTNPVLSTTTNYYASASFGNTESVGRLTTGSPVSLSATPRGLYFSATSPFTLKSVVVFPYSAGSGTVVVQNTAGTVLAGPVTVSWPAGTSGTTGHTVNLNLSVPAGNDLLLLMTSFSSGAIAYEVSGITGSFPFVSPSGTVSITGSRATSATPTTTNYYYFYDWQIQVGCESPRTAVEAYVDNSPTCSTLPVSGLELSGQNKNGINQLKWQTLTEVNNRGFEIQRSADGINFTRIAFVNSLSASGNSSDVLGYTFDDTKPLTTAGYYRLKQIDKDGKWSYSNIVMLKAARINKLEITQIYPNPVTNKLNVVVSSPEHTVMRMMITDITGKLIKQETRTVTAGDNRFTIDVSALSQGTYLIKAICNEGCENAVQKFVK